MIYTSPLWKSTRVPCLGWSLHESLGVSHLVDDPAPLDATNGDDKKSEAAEEIIRPSTFVHPANDRWWSLWNKTRRTSVNFTSIRYPSWRSAASPWSVCTWPGCSRQKGFSRGCRPGPAMLIWGEDLLRVVVVFRFLLLLLYLWLSYLCNSFIYQGTCRVARAVVENALDAIRRHWPARRDILSEIIQINKEFHCWSFVIIHGVKTK